MTKRKDTWTPEEELSILEMEQGADIMYDNVYSVPTFTAHRQQALTARECALGDDPRCFDFGDDDPRDHGVPDHDAVFADYRGSGCVPLNRQLVF